MGQGLWRTELSLDDPGKMGIKSQREWWLPALFGWVSMGLVQEMG